MFGNILVSISDQQCLSSTSWRDNSVIGSRKVLWVGWVFGWWWWWYLPIIESISWSRPWDLRMTKSFFRPCNLLELTWTWSGPRAWQYQNHCFKNFRKFNYACIEDRSMKITSIIYQIHAWISVFETYFIFDVLDTV